MIYQYSRIRLTTDEGSIVVWEGSDETEANQVTDQLCDLFQHLSPLNRVGIAIDCEHVVKKPKEGMKPSEENGVIQL